MSRVAVLSGPERRRRWASSEKARIVEESLVPGAMVMAVAQRHDVPPESASSLAPAGEASAEGRPKIEVPAGCRDGGGAAEVADDRVD
jgi:transposase